MPRVFDLVGNTPLAELHHICDKPGVTLYGKLEGQNPGGSVKDRAALSMIESALKRGDLPKGTKLIEATSGNTGIALAMVASTFGLDIELVMPENSTEERIKTMQAYGAKVILTPAAEAMEGSRDYADHIFKSGSYVMLNQFGNPDNSLAHYRSTGPEIWNDTQHKVTHFVSAMGTTGTIMGTSRFLKEQNADVQIIGAEPSEGSKIPGIRKWAPEYLPTIFDPQQVDQIIQVTETEARAMTKRLAKEEGILAGMSSGGAVAVAMKLIQNLDQGVVVCIICDRGDRYLSSDLFD